MDANLISKIQSKKTQKINTKETEGGDIRERGGEGISLVPIRFCFV